MWPEATPPNRKKSLQPTVTDASLGDREGNMIYHASNTSMVFTNTTTINVFIATGNLNGNDPDVQSTESWIFSLVLIYLLVIFVGIATELSKFFM